MHTQQSGRPPCNLSLASLLREDEAIDFQLDIYHVSTDFKTKIKESLYGRTRPDSKPPKHWKTEKAKDRKQIQICSLKNPNLLNCEKHANPGERTTLGSDDTSLLKSAEEQLEVWLLEQTLGWAFWVGGICNDYIEFILVIIQEFEAIANMGPDFGVLKSNGHSWEVLL